MAQTLSLFLHIIVQQHVFFFLKVSRMFYVRTEIYYLPGFQFISMTSGSQEDPSKPDFIILEME